jgi:hypothetical protein
MQIIGLPASVSAPGLFGKTQADEEELISLLLRTEKGLILGLNMHPDMDPGPAIPMTMLPTVIVNLPFKNWNEYLHSLRSKYRRRTKRILESFRDVAEIQTACNRFTEAHHALYKQVIEHSSNRLEELSIDYFKNLPEPFQLTTYYHQGRLLCWHIYCHEGDTLYFFFGGHDYRLLNEYQSYFNNLFGIIREAISEGYREIDLGQTAETAKLKTGGEMIPKQLFLYCRNSILRSLIRLCRPLLEYHYPKINYHMFLQSRSSI